MSGRGVAAAGPRVLLTLLLVLVAVRPVAAQPPLPERALTIVGSRDTYAVITVTEETYYYLDRATAQFAGGRWGGFLIGPDSSAVRHGWRDGLTLWTVWDDPPSSGSHAAALFRPVPARSAPYQTMTGVLSPGRYRLYLFTDGQQVTVTLPWAAPSRTVEPDAPFRSRIDVKQVVARGAGSATLVTMPLDGTSRSITESAAVFDYGGGYVSSVPGQGGSGWACYAPTVKPATQQTCYSGRQRSGSSRSMRLLGGQRTERVHGSMKGLEWRAATSPDTPGLVTAVTARYDP